MLLWPWEPCSMLSPARIASSSVIPPCVAIGVVAAKLLFGLVVGGWIPIGGGGSWSGGAVRFIVVLAGVARFIVVSTVVVGALWGVGVVIVSSVVGMLLLLLLMMFVFVTWMWPLPLKWAPVLMF